MSYQVVRVSKNKATSIGFVQRHNLRQYDQKHKAPSNVDSSKTHLNYALIECDKFKSAVKEKVDEVQAQQTRRIRKDCPTSLEYVISASPEFFEKASASEQREYFNSALKFIKNRHEVENVISAVVHMDEETPHMHVVVVPIRKNEKGLRLDPKSFCTPRELSKLQTDFNKQVAKKFNLERGESSDVKHQTTAEHNRQLQRENKELTAQIKEKKDLAAELDKLNGAEFKLPQIELPKAELLESKSAYGERVKREVLQVVSNTLKIAQAQLRDQDEIKKRNVQLENIQRNHESELSQRDQKIEKLTNQCQSLSNLIFHTFKKLQIDIGRSLNFVKLKNEDHLVLVTEKNEPLVNKFENWFDKIKAFLPLKKEPEKKKTISFSMDR